MQDYEGRQAYWGNLMLVYDWFRLHRGVKHGVSNIVREHLGARTGMRDKTASMLFGELIYPWFVLLSPSCFESFEDCVE